MSTQRVSFHFPREAATELAFIASHTRFEGAATIVRVALGSYRDLLEVYRSGCRLFVRDKNGLYFPYSLFSPFHYPGFDATPAAAPKHDKLSAAPRNLFFSGQAVEELAAIRKTSFVQNNADAIRAALTTFSELVRVIAAGDEIIIRDWRGNERSHDPRAPLARDGLDLNPRSGPEAALPNRPELEIRPQQPELVS